MFSKPKHEEDSDWRWFENSENSNVPTIRNKDNAAIKDTVYDMKVMMVASPHNIGEDCNTPLSLVVSEHQIGHQSQLVIFPAVASLQLDKDSVSEDQIGRQSQLVFCSQRSPEQHSLP